MLSPISNLSPFSRPLFVTGVASSLLTNLISYWKLNESSGDAMDAHGTNTLTETGGTIASTAGKIGNARDFEAGDTEWFERADNSDLSTGDIDFTFAAWVNAETTTGFPVILSKQSNVPSTQEYVFYLSSGRPTFDVKGAGVTSGSVQWGSALSAATWYYVVCWHDSVANQLGISVNNGTPVTAAWTTGVINGVQPFQIGASSAQGIYWDGLIDEVGFWKRILTSGERTSLYNAGAGLAYPF